jgi:hypothetical protein
MNYDGNKTGSISAALRPNNFFRLVNPFFDINPVQAARPDKSTIISQERSKLLCTFKES